MNLKPVKKKIIEVEISIWLNNIILQAWLGETFFISQILQMAN